MRARAAELQSAKEERTEALAAERDRAAVARRVLEEKRAAQKAERERAQRRQDSLYVDPDLSPFSAPRDRMETEEARHLLDFAKILLERARPNWRTPIDSNRREVGFARRIWPHWESSRSP